MFDVTHRYIMVLCLVLLFLNKIVLAEEPAINKLFIGKFSLGSLSGWETKEFKGQTQYRLGKNDGLMILKAASDNSASGLLYEQHIDLEKTPVLNWRWRIENPLSNPNELTKAGDDFVARIYVVVSGGLIFWNTKAINYVWANGLPKGKIWPNPFAGDHAMMLAVRSSADKAGIWYTEKRNVRNDFKKLMGGDIHFIDAVAIMTDTDNSGGEAAAYYGDIFFTAE